MCLSQCTKVGLDAHRFLRRFNFNKFAKFRGDNGVVLNGRRHANGLLMNGPSREGRLHRGLDLYALRVLFLVRVNGLGHLELWEAHNLATYPPSEPAKAMAPSYHPRGVGLHGSFSHPATGGIFCVELVRLVLSCVQGGGTLSQDDRAKYLVVGDWARDVWCHEFPNSHEAKGYGCAD